MTVWIDSLRQRRHADDDAYLVTVMDVRGSAPREPGAKMIVTASDLAGTIGGGQLEFQCTKLACDELLRPREGNADFVRTFPLGANCGQCCGGVVDVLFERVAADDCDWADGLLAYWDERKPFVMATSVDATAGISAKYLVTADDCRQFGAPFEAVDEVVSEARRMIERRVAAGRIRLERSDGTPQLVFLEPIMPNAFELALFGAGHVGSAVVAAMSRLDSNVRWIDSRRNVFPEHAPVNVTCIESAEPAREIAAMPAGSFYLVMTHSHPLDYEICDAILRRGDFAYLGLIGSISKRRRFERLMRKQGMAPSTLQRLTCPIGVEGIGGKKPAEIAIAVAAELLKTKEALATSASDASEGTMRRKNLHVLRR